MKHVRQKTAIAFGLIVRSPRQVHARNGALVVLQPLEKFRGNGGLPARRTESVAERFYIVEILAKDEGSRHGQGAANAVRLDQRIAVAIAANPRSELHDVGDRIFVQGKRVN